MHDANQDLYDALHGIQLWGIVGQTRDPLLGKGRVGSNDEFLAAYKRLKERVDAIVDDNAKLRELCIDAHQWMDRALYDGSARRHEYESITDRMRELGIEVCDESE